MSNIVNFDAFKEEASKCRSKIIDTRHNLAEAKSERKALILESLERLKVKVDAYQEVLDHMHSILKDTGAETIYYSECKELFSGYYFRAVATYNGKLTAGVFFTPGNPVDFNHFIEGVENNCSYSCGNFIDAFSADNIKEMDTWLDVGMKAAMEEFIKRLEYRESELNDKLKAVLSEISKYSHVEKEEDGSITIIVEGKKYKAYPEGEVND